MRYLTYCDSRSKHFPFHQHLFAGNFKGYLLCFFWHKAHPGKTGKLPDWPCNAAYAIPAHRPVLFHLLCVLVVLAVPTDEYPPKKFTLVSADGPITAILQPGLKGSTFPSFFTMTKPLVLRRFTRQYVPA